MTTKQPIERTPPPLENLKRIGETDFESYVKMGQVLFDQMHKLFRDYTCIPTAGQNVLDFGCGIGRVTFPRAAAYDATITACDVDPTAIRYIQENSHTINALVSSYNPPLPFEDGQFDLVYANSVFTHFPKDAEAYWLAEMARITHPGSKLFLSVAGYDTLKVHHRRGIDTHISEDTLNEEGLIFIENKSHDKDDPVKWPGVTHAYGLTRHSHPYVREVWGAYFDVIDIVPAASGKQDVVVLQHKKPAE